MSKINMFFYLLGLTILLHFSCSQSTVPTARPETTFYQEQIRLWQSEQVKAVTNPDGWLSLVGLFWLKEGETTFGSSELNNIQFPVHTPDYIGKFILENGNVSMSISENVPVKVGEEELKEVKFIADQDGTPNIATMDSLSWYLIRRENRYGIRLKNAKNSAMKTFKGIDNFPIDPNWVIPAYLRTSDDKKTVTLRNVVDMDVTMKLEGYLVFEIDGNSYELAAMDGGDLGYFIIFADETTGVETYGAGRYLYVPKVDETGKTLIDFNKSYNPPCAFTDFATCPLPAAENILKVRIPVGEMYGKK